MINTYSTLEASKKQCPILSTNCIVKACMLWIWKPNVRDKDTLEELRTHGYCGLTIIRKD